MYLMFFFISNPDLVKDGTEKTNVINNFYMTGKFS